MSIQKRTKLVPWLAGFAALLLAALVALPSLAASTTVNKTYAIDVTNTAGGSLSTVGGTSYATPGDNTFKVTVTNATTGSSNFSSVVIKAPTKLLGAASQNIWVKNASILKAPDSNNGNGTGGVNASATIQFLNKAGSTVCLKPAAVSSCPTLGSNAAGTNSGALVQGNIYVQNIDPVKSASNLHQRIAFNITLDVAAPSGCNAVNAVADWNAIPVNGTSLAGDSFAIQGPNSGQTTSVSGQCGTLTINKYQDSNVNDQRDSGEPLLTQGWQFTITDSSNSSQNVSTDGTGSVTVSLAAGTYTICETDPKLGAPAPNNWESTDPDGCKTATVNSSSNTSKDFGNLIGNLGCDNTNNTLSDNGATIVRGRNTDGSEPCHLKPASLTYDTSGVVTFLATGSDPASYTLTIPWAPVANTNPPPAIKDEVDLPGGTHAMKWCDSATGGNNGGPVIPDGEVACIVSQTWTTYSDTQIQRVDVIYAEIDLVVSKSPR